MSSKFNTVQRSRLCVFENETNTVFISASVVATIIARIDGDFKAMLAPGIPVFWLSEQDIIKVAGEASWDEVVRRVSFDLLSITFTEWTEERVLSIVRQTFPTTNLQRVNS